MYVTYSTEAAAAGVNNVMVTYLFTRLSILISYGCHITDLIFM
jgi:hypothetical protein